MCDNTFSDIPDILCIFVNCTVSGAQAFARYIQCEDAVSQYGLLGKHPTTGGVMASPFVQMSQQFQKSANLIWYEIYDIVKRNCTEQFSESPHDAMEELLRRRG